MENKPEYEIEIIPYEDKGVVEICFWRKGSQHRDVIVFTPDEAVNIGSYLMSAGMELGGKVQR